MDIIRCNCGHYKKLDDELCPVCKADYSLGAEYEVLDDQELALKRWNSLGGEKGFNEYMKSIEGPKYMVCPKCNFKMLISETSCPKCGIDVHYVPGKKVKQPFEVRLMDVIGKCCSIHIVLAFIGILIFLLIVFGAIIRM